MSDSENETLTLSQEALVEWNDDDLKEDLEAKFVSTNELEPTDQALPLHEDHTVLPPGLELRKRPFKGKGRRRKKTKPTKHQCMETPRISNSGLSDRKTNNAKPQRPTVANLSPLPHDGTADFDSLLKQVKTPSPDGPLTTTTTQSTSSQSSPCDDLQLSAEDLEAMDALVQTQIHSEKRESSTDNGELSSPDFEFSQDDFEMMDSMVAGATKVQKCDTDAMTSPMSSVASRVPLIEVGNLSMSLSKDVVFHDTHDAEKPDEDAHDEFAGVDFAAIDNLVEQRACTMNEDAIQKDFETMDRRKKQFSFPSPSVPVKNPRSETKITFDKRSHLTFSRYMVTAVDIDTPSFTKSLSVAAWDKEMLQLDDRVVHRSDGDGILRFSTNNKSWTIEGRIHLRGEWYASDVQQGDFIHVCSLTGLCRTDSAALPLILDTFPPQGSEPDDLVLVVHPDDLVTPTSISGSISCNRRAIIQTRLGSSGLHEKSQLFGTLRHELLQECLRKKDFSSSSALTVIQTIVNEAAEDLVSCRMSTQEGTNELVKFIPQLQSFARVYTDIDTSVRRRRKAFDEATQLEDPKTRRQVRFLAKGVEAIEEPVTSHELGLKGFVDVIFKALTSSDKKSEPTMYDFVTELKTGHNQKTQAAHMAQLTLYILMLQSREGSPMAGRVLDRSSQPGMLLYMNNESVRATATTTIVSELKTLVVQRNLVACQKRISSVPRGLESSFVDDEDTARVKLTTEPTPRTQLPEFIRGSHQCGNCFANRECMLYGAVEIMGEQTRAPGDKVDLLKQLTGHLTTEELRYFAKWDHLVDLEAHASSSRTTEMWLQPASEIENSTGKAVSGLQFDEDSCQTSSNGPGKPFALLVWRRDDVTSQTLSSLGLQPGCQLLVSVDSTTTVHRDASVKAPTMNLVRGFFHNATERTLTIKASLDDLRRVQRFVARSCTRHVFRVDVDTISTGIGTLRQNLNNLFTLDTRVSDDVSFSSRRRTVQKLRGTVVRCAPPVFSNNPPDDGHWFSTEAAANISMLGCGLGDLKTEFETLNKDQQNAARKILCMEDYCLVQGLPGTGKSKLIAFVTRLLVAHGKRVLVTSYTHSAVDNVLLKLIETGMTTGAACSDAVVRVGNSSRCHANIRPYLAGNVAMKRMSQTPSCRNDDRWPTVESLRDTVKAARVVGVTALTAPRSALLWNEHFDVVIVDEAGQISQPAVLGALMRGNTFILVGDQLQLPPLVFSELALEGGYGDSMLKRLVERHPQALAKLTIQYRMNESICNLCNDIIYGGMLRCANDAVRNRRLSVQKHPDRDGATWLEHVVDPFQATLFLNTDSIFTGDGFVTLESSTCRGKGGNTVNRTEANVVEDVVKRLNLAGVAPGDIGVVCPFRAQVALLERQDTLATLLGRGLEISTVDRFQGRDKEAVILTFVRSNRRHRTGRLLQDVRRLNVAVSRAKSKLIMVGSIETLMNGCDPLKPALLRLANEGRIVELPTRSGEVP